LVKITKSYFIIKEVIQNPEKIMRKFNIPISALVILALSSLCYSQTSTVKGEYMGQKPPGLTPELFAPGIVSTGLDELNSVFTPDGKEFYFAVRNPRFTILFMKQINNQWTKSRVAPFSGEYGDVDHFLSPDGKKLYYASNRPLSGEGKPKRDFDIWVVERTGSGWSEPKNLGHVINSGQNEFYPSVSVDGTLFFNSDRDGGFGRSDIYKSELINGHYTKPENLKGTISTEYHEHDPLIAPDGSFLIFASGGRPGGMGGSDLYISFMKEDGTWTDAQHMGENINSNTGDYCPILSPEGKYFFFTSHRRLHESYSEKSRTFKEILKLKNSPGNGGGDIYWVDAKIIDTYKPDRKENVKKLEDFPVLRDEYLGMKKPGLIPEIFAPGIISKGYTEACPAFSPGGKEFYFGIQGQPFSVIMFMEQKNGLWAEPQVAPFSGRYSDGEFNLSPDGNKFMFISLRPLTGKGKPIPFWDIWFMDRTESGWSKPYNPGELINSDKMEAYPSMSNYGTLYFSSNRAGGKGRWDIYRSKFVNGRYARPESLDEAINTGVDEWDSFIAPDESYIIFCSNGRKDSYGQSDLYISFKKKDGAWAEAKNMGKEINSSAGEFYPGISPDGKYFFFSSMRRTPAADSGVPLTYDKILKFANSPGNGNGDIYWVDAKIIEKFRPVE